MTTFTHSSERIYDALKSLIEVSREFQREHRLIEECGKAALKEFCTIRIQGSRRSGHTTVAKRICEEMNAIYMPYNQDMGDMSGIRPFISVNSPQSLRGRDCEAIVIDVASMVSKKKLDIIYDTVAPIASRRKEFFVILLG